jgi:hypothetical protein
MTEEEKKEDNSKDFGKVIDVLHNKQKLSSLRTYQGDVADFIKSKNESVISVAVKEKERKEERIEKGEEVREPKSNKTGFQINLTMIVLSLLLIVGGLIGLFYAFQYFNKEPASQVVIESEIIPYNSSINLANVVSGNLGTEIAKLSPVNGISIIKISDTNGLAFQKAKDFFDFLKISPPSELIRILKDQYVVGLISQNGENSPFIAVTVNDFGIAFSAMLEWEKNMANDLSFLNTKIVTVTPVNTVASSTASTTIVVQVPTKPETFSWKDIIIKNKDTRSLINEKGKSKIAYTFLDKNTILITNNIEALGEISSVYASRSVAR